MDPITIAAIVSGLASTAVNAYAAYKKGEISEAEYRRASQAANELERQLKALRPDENWENINPALLSETAKFSPDIAAFVQENAPELIQEAGSATEKRVQREALQKYAAMSESGRDVISEAQREQALFESDARAKQRQRALMEAMRRQGQLGSGAALQAQLSQEQAEAVNARQAALQGVQEAEMRRRQALDQAAGLAGQIRGQNLNVESANVGTMNAYNQRLANAKNMYNQYASGARNQAQMINQQREMERERYNLGLQNQYAMFNRQQRDAAKERARQYDVDRVTRMYDAREGAERNRSAGQMQKYADYATAINSGIGTGMSVYGGLSSAGANAAKQSFYEAAKQGLGQGLGQGVGQGLSSNATRSVFQNAYTPQFMESRELEPIYEMQQTDPYYYGPWRPKKIKEEELSDNS